MTCPKCSKAADNRAPREAHCAHRVDRYGQVTTPIAATTGQPPDTP